MKKEYPRNTVEFVRIGYHDACINFLVTFRGYPKETNRLEELKQAIQAAGQYNEFDPDKIIAALDAVSQPIERIDFGREGSPVMYLHLHTGVYNAAKNTYRNYRGSELQKLEDQVKAAFTDTVFDEFSREGNIVRIWWD